MVLVGGVVVCFCSPPSGRAKHPSFKVIMWSAAAALSAMDEMVNTSVTGFSHYNHVKFAHPFQPHASLWLSKACETTTWLMKNEQKLMKVMNSSLRCDAVGMHESAARAARPMVVDVGTNCGVYTVAAATCGYEIFSFEVQPKCIRMMRATLAINRVSDEAYHIHHQPVSDEARAITLPAARSCAGTYSFSRADRKTNQRKLPRPSKLP